MFFSFCLRFGSMHGKSSIDVEILVVEHLSVLSERLFMFTVFDFNVEYRSQVENVLVRIFYIPSTFFFFFLDNCLSALSLALLNLRLRVLDKGTTLFLNCIASYADRIGKAWGANDFIISLTPFINNSGYSMSWGLKCLSHTILFTVNCKPKLELHSSTHSYKISNKNNWSTDINYFKTIFMNDYNIYYWWCEKGDIIKSRIKCVIICCTSWYTAIRIKILDE